MADDHYECRGYQIFRAALDPAKVGSIGESAYRLITPYRGQILRRDGEPEFNTYLPSSLLIWNPPLNLHALAPEGLEPVSAAIRSLITSPALANSLHALDGADHYIIHQTILFLTAATTDLHNDSWTLDTAPHGGFHSIWIPLEEMSRTSGMPCVIPWPRGKIVTEAELGLQEGGPFGERFARYQQALADRVLSTTPEVVTAFLRLGDFMVWASTTPHCTLPSYPWPKKRMALQVMARPSDTRWGNFCDQSREPSSGVERITDRFSFLHTPHG